MSRADSLSKRIWLHMLAEGGRWTATELAKIAFTDSATVAGQMRGMVEAGYVIRHERDNAVDSRVQFSVTNSCKGPAGMTVDEFADAAKKAMAL